jgi:hypothetical protein
MLEALVKIAQHVELQSYLMQHPVKIERTSIPKPVEFPQPFVDASELLARWLWLQLPEESKKDLMA